MPMHPALRQHVASELRKQAARYVDEALQTVVEVMQESEDPEVRLKAANMIFDRAAGKPTQEAAHENGDIDRLGQVMRAALESTNQVMGALPPPRDTPLSQPVTITDAEATEVPNEPDKVVPMRRRMLAR